MSKNQYTLFHRPSGNWLDWFDTLEEAIEARARWVASAPEAAPELEIWDDKNGARIDLDAETSHPAPAA